MIRFSDSLDSTYLYRAYTIEAIYEVYKGTRSDRSDKHAILGVTIFRQAGRPDFVDCISDRTIAMCQLPKACVIFMDGETLPAINMRWTGESFEIDIYTVGDEYTLGFSFETQLK